MYAIFCVNVIQRHGGLKANLENAFVMNDSFSLRLYNNSTFGKLHFLVETTLKTNFATKTSVPMTGWGHILFHTYLCSPFVDDVFIYFNRSIITQVVQIA